MPEFIEVAPRVWVAHYDWMHVNITLIGGWFVFVANMLALVHLVFLGASIAFDKVREHPLAQITAGEWFTKIIFGVWVVAIAGNLAAAVLVFG